MIKEFTLTTANMEAFFERRDYTKGPYIKVNQERWIKKKTATLVEDEDLVLELLRFTENRWELDNHKLTASDIKYLLENKYEVLDLLKIDHKTKSGYEEQWIRGDSYEEDYSLTGWHYKIVRHSFSHVLDEFTDRYPKKVKFKTKVDWIKEEEY